MIGFWQLSFLWSMIKFIPMYEMMWELYMQLKNSASVTIRNVSDTSLSLLWKLQVFEYDVFFLLIVNSVE